MITKLISILCLSLFLITQSFAWTLFQGTPKAFIYGYQAYEYAKKRNITKSRYLVIIDFSRPANQQRFYVIDMKTKTIIASLGVAHGVNSGGWYPTKFSNINGSKQSSLGVMITGFMYGEKGNLRLKLIGLESVNDNVFKRHVVIHQATYVHKNGATGVSWGCPAIPFGNDALIKLIGSGTLVFTYYPDQTYLDNSRFLNG